MDEVINQVLWWLFVLWWWRLTWVICWVEQRRIAYFKRICYKAQYNYQELNKLEMLQRFFIWADSQTEDVKTVSQYLWFILKRSLDLFKWKYRDFYPESTDFNEEEPK